VGSWILTLSILVFLYNVYKTWRYGEKVTVEDPWGFGSSLEWATSCPPPRHNFYRIPRIRSERPAFELHYPHLSSGAVPRSVMPSPPEPGPSRPEQ
jgi:cytochrome c oxidase subunit 1